MDGGVSKQCFGVSKWMVVFPDFILSSTTASPYGPSIGIDLYKGLE